MATRGFVNELGNPIKITVATEVPDYDLVCRRCRWRGGHSVDCEQVAEPWPVVQIPNDRTRVLIEWPFSTCETYLTPRELSELHAALGAHATAWLPMETAPKEPLSLSGWGPRIRVWAWGEERHARWDPHRGRQKPSPFWQIEGLTATLSREHPPACWQPTSPAPVDAK